MSAEAMAAFHRLRIRPRVDGTAKLVLSYLCWRHDSKQDLARPSTERIAQDLDLGRSSVTSALARLNKAGLVRRKSGGGRGRATRYHLPFLQIHRISPDPTLPIEINLKLSGEPDTLPSETVRASDTNCPVQRTKTVRAAGQEKKKSIKSRSTGATERAGGPGATSRGTDADRVFEKLLAKNEAAKRTPS
jgi:DNA-binding transcriptional ArsR family regulator